MNYFYLAITQDDYSSNLMQSKGFLETLGFGAQMLLIGMATVFAVLILLWICLALFARVFDGKKEKEEPQIAPPAPEVTPVVQHDDELVAVIAAAIATAESEHSGAKFRVVSFRRK